MAKIETRTVYRKEDGLRTIINVDDYDPEIHSTKIPKDKLSPEKYAEEREQGKKLAAKALGNAPKAAAEKLKGNG